MLGDSRSLSELEGLRLKALYGSLHSLLIRKKRICREKSRTSNFKLKDHNSRLIHAITMIKRKRNDVKKFLVNGDIVEGVTTLREKI